MIIVLIPTLAGSATHEAAITLYLGHLDSGAGACARCGRPAPCRVQAHAAQVIMAAGEDPRRYDGPPAREHPDRPGPGETHPDHLGISIAGRTVPIDPANYLYERSQ